ncbi:MAG: DUF4440 domain-containing protein [Luteimonas sp.]|nr:DUF4440 domain-containing protein [Luteimonas sp.]
MRFACLSLAAALLIVSLPASAAEPSAKQASTATEQTSQQQPTQRQIEGLAQELLDAITYGRPEVWRRILHPRALIADEDGKVYTKDEMVSEIRPLPAGYEGELRIANPKFSLDGDMAVLSYDTPESLKLYGQTLHTLFRATDVYRRVDGQWLLFAKQIQVIPAELGAVRVDAVRGDTVSYDAYVGRYELGADAALVVTREGGRLYSQRDARPRDELLPIGGDRFVRKGHPRGERFFRRDAGGKVDALVDRRDNEDLVWRRVPMH